MTSTTRLLTTLGIGSGLLSSLLVLLAQSPQIGPETEKRFPPLRVPAGFKATLFACDPLVEYPSAVALGPRPRSLFVAADYLTGLGTEIVRRDEVKLVEDTDSDGYADRVTVYAAEFNSIQGLTYHEGTLYVMHAPLLTALRDTDGDGKADERRDLVNGLGLSPEQNPVRLHCANGLVMGHDNWLYLAMGDHGCTVKRPEGDQLVLRGGGILRCSPDGRGLHVFATGLRNIYDVALDEDLEVFVRDNENDGGDYKVRVCHSFFGADHGYPYLYYERPDEALPPLADLGLGSSAGGACYLEDRFPPEYRGNLFFCEWGRAVMRYRPERSGSGFAPLKETEFASGDDKDPYGFKPTDVVVDRDGSLIVVDWADGQRPKRGRGRIYRIEPAGIASPGVQPLPTQLAELVAQLGAASYLQRSTAQAAIERRGPEGAKAVRDALRSNRLGIRGRKHAVWILANAGAPISELLDIARTDPEARVQVQALRALADRADPALGASRAEAAPLAIALSEIGAARGPRVLREIIVALGRLGWPSTPDWLRKVLTQPDPVLEHAALQTLRRSANWPAVLRLLDQEDDQPLRSVALRAIGDRAEPVIVDGLISRLERENDPARRRAYADALVRVCKKPGPWTYWGYRPPPRPPNTVSWERTGAITTALDRLLADPDRTVRLAVLERMRREKVPIQPGTLRSWLRNETSADSVAVLLAALREGPLSEALDDLAALVRKREHSVANRLTALTLLVDDGGEKPHRQLAELVDSLEEGPVLAELLRRSGRFQPLADEAFLKRATGSVAAEVRAAAIEALAERRVRSASPLVVKLLTDGDPGVRVAAAVAAGKLAVQPAVDLLVECVRDPQAGVRQASLEALRQLRDPRTVALASGLLTDRLAEMTALRCLAELGGPEQGPALAELARRHPSAEVLTTVVRTLTSWSNAESTTPAQRLELDRAVADVQGKSGVLLRWRSTEMLRDASTSSLLEQLRTPKAPFHALDALQRWQTSFAAGADSRVTLGSKLEAEKRWLSFSDVLVSEPTPVQLLGSSSGTCRVWLNGRQVHARSQDSAFQPDSERFIATLDPGLNRLAVEVVVGRGDAIFQLRFRHRSSAAEQEALAEAALARPGDADRGRKVLLDVEKSLCLKCHRLGEQGERIGPELTGVGSRFSRIHLIESILQPSWAIAASFETSLVSLANGRVLTGLVIEETPTALVLADNQGQKHTLARSGIEERQRLPQSTMPDGLEKRLTRDEFIDLVAFLVSQKEKR